MFDAFKKWVSGDGPCQKFPDSEALFNGLRDGKTAAIQCLQLKSLSTVRKTTRRFGFSNELTDDILNKSTLVFLQKIRAGDYVFQGGTPVTFFVNIAKNVALAATRNRPKTTENLENYAHLPDPETENDQKRNDNKELVRLLLGQLGEPCATVVRLFYIESFSDEEVVNQQLTKYSSPDSLKVKRSDCMKKLVKLAQQWKSKNT